MGQSGQSMTWQKREKFSQWTASYRCNQTAVLGYTRSLEPIFGLNGWYGSLPQSLMVFHLKFTFCIVVPFIALQSIYHCSAFLSLWLHSVCQVATKIKARWCKFTSCKRWNWEQPFSAQSIVELIKCFKNEVLMWLSCELIELSCLYTSSLRLSLFD